MNLKNLAISVGHPLLFYFALIGIVLVLLLVGFLLGFIVMQIKYHSKIKKSRKDAVNRSRAVIAGQISEQLAPYLPNFPCSPECVQFLGKPVDFVGFVPEDDSVPLEERKIKEILFIEIKTGKAVQTKREKEVQKAVEQGKVRYTVVNL